MMPDHNTDSSIVQTDEKENDESNQRNLFNLTQLWQLITKLVSDTSINAPIAPINILGREFNNNEEFEAELKNKVCLTYRFGFEKIPKVEDGPNPLSYLQSVIFSRNLFLENLQNFNSLMDNEFFTNDVGWGCMIRTSQSLLANAIVRLKVGVADKTAEIQEVNNVIDMFLDNSSAPFSLHNFIRVASELPLKVKPGEWFGPSAASLSIKRLSNSINLEENKSIPKMSVLISETCDLYESKIEEIFADNDLSGLLILLPIRLGIHKINPIYHSSLLQLVSLKQSVGIAGGKPSSSFYFLGHQGNNLIYLNPHFPQAISDSNSTPDYDTYHTTRYQTLDINDLDPCMMIGILLFNFDDYQDFKNECAKVSNKIVHFHGDAKNAKKDDHAADLGYQFDFDEESNDDFININSDLQGNEDFIDVATEIPDIDDADESSLVAETVTDLEEVSHSNQDGSQEELINISDTMSKDYENLDNINDV